MNHIRLRVAALAILLFSACSISTARHLTPALASSCRSTGNHTTVAWAGPQDPSNRSRLDAFCAAVGPVLFEPAAARNESSARPQLQDVAFVSWSLHVGAGDVERFVADLQAGRLTNGREPAHIVMMLQEAVRADGVPGQLPEGASSARRIGAAGGDDHREIEAIARDLGMSVFYAPSMRNGAASERYKPTDRGNAILSTLPLSSPAAIELPGDRQRRVAITAAVPVRIGERDVDLSIGAAHLDTMGRARTFWLIGASSLRGEQARALVAALPAHGPLVVGADLNSWLGTSEPAPRTLAQFLPDTPSERRTGTFLGGLVLDYMFFRSPDGCRGHFDRVPDTYGSDHYPLVGWLDS